jgi:hypothetical protein
MDNVQNCDSHINIDRHKPSDLTSICISFRILSHPDRLWVPSSLLSNVYTELFKGGKTVGS